MTASRVAILALPPILLWISLLIAWWRFRVVTRLSLSTWRRIVFRAGLAGNALSLLLLSGFLAFTPMLYRTCLLSFGLLFALFTVVLGAFGRSLPRLLVMVNAVSLAYLWLLLGLANSD
jgi:hypothetical protein